MGLLRRRKKKDEEELEEEQRELKKKKRRTPTEPRKKKPPKPWGRNERIILLIILFSTVVLSGIFAMSARSWKLPGLPRIKAPSIPEFSLLSNEKIILEGNSENLEKSESTISEFNRLTGDLSGVYGLYVISLTDGFSYGVNQHEDFEPASLNKLPVMFAAYQEHEAGNFDLDEEYSLKSSDKIGGSGSLSGKPTGTVLTYRELVELMGKQSDNTAFGIVKSALGDDIINITINELGMGNTNVDENKTTPTDIGTFFERLYKGSLISEDSRNELLSFLTDTIYEAWIPDMLPSDVKVSHKFGREIHVVNDAGIVFTKDPYILVVMSKGAIEREADEVIPQISRAIFDIEGN